MLGQVVEEDGGDRHLAAPGTRLQLDRALARVPAALDTDHPGRRAGFEPRVRSESFHTCWDIGTLADIDAVSLVPESVARELPAGVEAREVEGPVDEFETAVLWRKGETSAVATAFREIARAYFSSSSEPSIRMSPSVAA